MPRYQVSANFRLNPQLVACCFYLLPRLLPRSCIPCMCPTHCACCAPGTGKTTCSLLRIFTHWKEAHSKGEPFRWLQATGRPGAGKGTGVDGLEWACVVGLANPQSAPREVRCRACMWGSNELDKEPFLFVCASPPHMGFAFLGLPQGLVHHQQQDARARDGEGLQADAGKQGEKVQPGHPQCDCAAVERGHNFRHWAV